MMANPTVIKRILNALSLKVLANPSLRTFCNDDLHCSDDP